MHRQALPSNRAKGLRPHKGLHDAHHGRLEGRPCRASLPGGLTNPGFGRPCRATHPGLWKGSPRWGLRGHWGLRGGWGLRRPCRASFHGG